MEQLQLNNTKNSSLQCTKKQKRTLKSTLLSIIGVILCVFLIPIVIINCILMYQILTNQEQLPSIANYTPLIVLTESMEPTIQSGDLIICRNTAAENVNENDIISFYDPASNSSSIITHRVVQVIQKDGNIFFETKGDNNNVADTELVPAENLVGVYKTQIHDIGSLLMYMQTTQGLLTCVILPIGLILLYDKIRNNLQAKKLS